MTPKTTIPKRAKRVSVLATAVLALFLLSLSAGAGAQPCPTTIDETEFASADELRALNAKIASFGLRNPGSTEHDRMLDWLESELRSIPGMKLRSDWYDLTRWQPLPRSSGSRTVVEAVGSVAWSSRMRASGSTACAGATSSRRFT